MTLGMFNSVIGNAPEHVQEGFMERMAEMHDHLARESESLELFGEAWEW